MAWVSIRETAAALGVSTGHGAAAHPGGAARGAQGWRALASQGARRRGGPAAGTGARRHGARAASGGPAGREPDAARPARHDARHAGPRAGAGRPGRAHPGTIQPRAPGPSSRRRARPGTVVAAGIRADGPPLSHRGPSVALSRGANVSAAPAAADNPSARARRGGEQHGRRPCEGRSRRAALPLAVDVCHHKRRRYAPSNR